MRVLFIHSGNMYGGVEAMLATLARSRGLCPTTEQHFGLCFSGRLSEELHAAGAPVHNLGNARIRQPLAVRRARKVLGDLLTHVPFDSVICQSSWSQALFGPVARSFNLPLVSWIHGVSNGNHWLERWGRRTAADLNICNSQFTAEAARRFWPLTRAEVLHCPVTAPTSLSPESARAAVRSELDTPQNSVVIIHASRLEAWKGHASLLDALGALKDSPRWTCWIAGGAQRPSEVEYLKGLKAKADCLGIGSRVKFLGPRTDVERLLAAADIHCQPNTAPEPFGIAFVEALNAGLPVVTTSIGGAREIVDDTCGLLVPHGHQVLTDALRRLINDASLRSQLSLGGPARAFLLCDPAQQMKKLERLLSSVSRREKAA